MYKSLYRYNIYLGVDLLSQMFGILYPFLRNLKMAFQSSLWFLFGGQ